MSMALSNPFIAPGEINKFTLAPGELEYIKVMVPFGEVPISLVKGLDKTFDAMVQESGLGLRITADYKNETDLNTTVRISKTYIVYKKRAYVVGSTEPQ